MGDYFHVPYFAMNKEYIRSVPEKFKRLRQLRFALFAQENYFRYSHQNNDFNRLKRWINHTFTQMYSRAWLIDQERSLIPNQITINLDLFTKLRYLHAQIYENWAIEI